jgi:anti-sigma B factor antagonist
MSIKTTSSDGILIIEFLDPRILDEGKLQSVARDVVAAIEKSDEDNIILDFQHVQFMSSSMLGKLVLIDKKCKEFKAKLRLCGISDEIRTVFKITKLDKVFKIDSDQAAAVKAIQKRGLFG